ncbi:adenylosuccinate lyase [Candidatus Marinamargulisbacteria bacterium SCGC AG-414-C22]|nr:adenylosuccinate lyase [Candidatus Marinamargulisbacteria bacterium SCGC AG-414-C22]
MIKRYSRPAMESIWTAQNKFQKWLDIEVAACEAHHTLGNIPAEDLKVIKEKANFDLQRIDEIEAEIHHDVIAFTTSVAEFVGPSSRYVHLGLTSSDVVDTGFSLLIVEAGNVLLTAIDTLMETLATQADTYKLVLMMGRTHGVHAEPTTLGLKLTVWYEEMKRNRKRLEAAIKECQVGKISGAVGNYAHISPKIEEMVCNQLGLTPSNISTQILQRDRHAGFMTTLAIIAGTLEKMATEIRGLQKTEFNEITEPFSKKQKGSSAMPHKKNPIICERVTGLARTMRGYALTALENQALWHERDISHSSTERIIFPDATVGLDYMFGLMTRVIKDMVVNQNEMKRNIELSYNVFFSQKLLLRMVEKGLSREESYRIVQRNAHSAFDEKVLFDKKIKTDDKITSLFTEKELSELISFDQYTQHIDLIYGRVYTH